MNDEESDLGRDCLGGFRRCRAGSDSGARSTAAPAAAAPPAAPITDADLKGVEAPKAEARAKGDPDGALTGTVADVAVADAKKGLTIADLVNQVGQNKIAINFVWTLIAGFLVMFMQAGFAIVETGLCRAKNANHTMMMNFMVYGVGMLAYWLIGFAHPDGRRRRGGQPGRHAAARTREFADQRSSARPSACSGRTASS